MPDVCQRCNEMKTFCECGPITDFVSKLRLEDPKLVELYSNMDKNILLNQICAEVLDARAMEHRVSVFMELCTDNMSNTNYTEESIRTLVNQKQEKDINDFCKELQEMDNEDAISEIEERAS